MPRQEVDCGSIELCQQSFVSQNYLYCMSWIRESCAGFEGKTGAAVLMVWRLLWDTEGLLLTHILWSTGSLVQPGALPSGSPQPEPGTCVQAASIFCRSRLEPRLTGVLFYSWGFWCVLRDLNLSLLFPAAHPAVFLAPASPPQCVRINHHNQCPIACHWQFCFSDHTLSNINTHTHK